MALFCFLKIQIGGDNINERYFSLPNNIFDKGLSPIEFVVYSFLVRARDQKGQSFWSVPKIARYCGVCDTTCRKALASLEEKGYIDISKRYIDNVQQSNLYTVNRI